MKNRIYFKILWEGDVVKKVISNLFSGDEFKVSIVALCAFALTGFGCYLMFNLNDIPVNTASLLKFTYALIIGGSSINIITEKMNK